MFAELGNITNMYWFMGQAIVGTPLAPTETRKKT